LTDQVTYFQNQMALNSSPSVQSCAAYNLIRKRSRIDGAAKFPEHAEAVKSRTPENIMLKRILEAEVMESNEEAVAYDDMDHRTVNEQFVHDLLAAGPIEGEVCDIGTGTARIPLLLCDQTEDVRVFAVDLSYEMLEIARMNVELSSRLERVTLGHCDAKHLQLDDNRFDVVISNSIVHHIPEPASTFAEAVRICKPGGLLFFRDLLRPESDEEVNQLVETYAGDEATHAKQMFDDSLRAAFTVEEIQVFVVDLGFPANTVTTTSDRHWTWSAINPT
jgi:ubiquinone/menaquinone biosynthesis C-methylase UbiE